MSSEYHPIIPRDQRKKIEPNQTADDGVKCPVCHCRHVPVVKSIRWKHFTRRRRKCRHCGHFFWTREQNET